MGHRITQRIHICDLCDKIPEIKAHALSRGFKATEISVFFDNMTRFWRFYATIEKGTENE